MVADRPSLPPPPMLPPPHPCPCLRRHHRCSLRQRHCPSNAPVDGWLLCRLLPLACCIVCCPNLSAPAVVRCVVDAFSAGPPSPFADHCQPLSVLFYRASIAFAAPIAGWLLRSPSARQHNNHITKLKTFPVSTFWTYFDLLRVISTCERMKNLRGCQFFLSSYDLISTDSYAHVGKCVRDRIPRHDFVGEKKG